MKTLSKRKTLSFFLACWFLFVNVPLGSASVQQLPSITPARYSIVDSRTYTVELERQKKYDQYLSLLKTELSAVRLMEMNVRGGVVLTEEEKAEITEVFTGIGSKDPINDFLRMCRIDPVTKVYDPEGKLYILDDLAHIYTYGLVDFKKAQEYNRQAKSQYEKIKGLASKTNRYLIISTLPSSPLREKRYSNGISPRKISSLVPTGRG